jgi:hypothetical protein
MLDGWGDLRTRRSKQGFYSANETNAETSVAAIAKGILFKTLCSRQFIDHALPEDIKRRRVAPRTFNRRKGE